MAIDYDIPDRASVVEGIIADMDGRNKKKLCCCPPSQQIELAQALAAACASVREEYREVELG